MVVIRTKEGWQGDVHRVDAELWVSKRGAKVVGNDEGGDADAALPKAKPVRKPRAQPIETAAAVNEATAEPESSTES